MIDVCATPLRVRMLDGFSICRDGETLHVSDRSRKLYLLLACLIWERERPVPCEELIDLLEIQRDSNALNSLKALVHRTRTQLEQLGKGTGHALLLSRDGGYQWNPEVPVTLDAEEFETLCRRSREAPEQRLEPALEALELYRGDLLPALSEHPWAASRAEALREQYLETLLNALPLLDGEKQWHEVERLAGAAQAFAPCREDLCRWRMEALVQLERRREAVRVYDEFQETLLARLGVLPSDALREYYWKIQPARDGRAISSANLLEHLQEPARPGALKCDYDFFRMVCHSMARMAGRSGDPLHVALISISGQDESALPRSSLDRAMDNLEDIILSHMRRGDTATRCSASQFILLLPWASYDNCRMICSRIVRAFGRQFPHSPARFQFSVQPLLSSQ